MWPTWLISYYSYWIKFVYYTVITSVCTTMRFGVRSARISMSYSVDLELGRGLWSVIVDEVSIICEFGVRLGIVASSNVGGIALKSFETQTQLMLTQNWPNPHQNLFGNQISFTKISTLLMIWWILGKVLVVCSLKTIGRGELLILVQWFVGQRAGTMWYW